MSQHFNSSNLTIGGLIQRKPETKKDYLKLIEDGGINLLVEGSFAVQMGPNNYKFRTLPYNALHQSFEAKQVQKHHEMLRGPCKLFFDIDSPLEPESVPNWLSRFFSALFTCIDPVEASNDLKLEEFASSFSIYERARVSEAKNGNKFSLHIIQNNGTHFSSPAHVGSYLTSIGFDYKSFDVDNKYKEGNLQPIGGCKYDEVTGPNFEFYNGILPPMVTPLGYEDGDELSFSEFCKGFVNFIPAGSELIEVAAVGHRPRVNVQDEYTGIHRALIDEAMVKVKSIEGNEDCEIGLFLHQDENLIHIALEFAPRCAHLDDSDPIQHSGSKLKIYIKEEYMEIICPCRPPIARKLVPLSFAGEKAYLFAKTSLPLLYLQKLNRVDFPITPEELGKRCLPLDWHVSALGWEDFVYHPPRSGTGYSFSTVIWRYLNGESLMTPYGQGNLELMIAYVNLFFNNVMDRRQIVERTQEGYSYISYDHCKKVALVQLERLEEREYGRAVNGVKPTKIVRIPIHDQWLKNVVGFSRSIRGPFQMPSHYFNSLQPAATDFTFCLDEWNSLDNDSPLRLMLEALWDRYLSIVTGNEASERRDECRAWLEKWMLSILFNIGQKLFVNVWLVSSEHGTGKSTMFEIICKALGTQLSITSRSIGEFVRSRFNNSGNSPLVFFDDALDAKLSEHDGNQLKNLTTCQTFKSAVKNGEENKQDDNIMNFCFACNPGDDGAYIPQIGKERERRNFAQEVMSSVQQEAYLEDEGRYDCDCLDGLVCENHSFADFATFWMLFREHIMGATSREGDLFHCFIGMLFHRFNELKRTGAFRRTLQITLPVCQAIAKHQQVSSNLTERWYNQCMARGYTACPFGGAQDIFDRQKIAWPESLVLEQNGEASWIEWLPITTLLKTFRLEMTTQTGEKTFENQLNQISMVRMNKGLEVSVKPCITFEYKLDTSEHPPVRRWVPMSGASKNQKCVRLTRMNIIDPERLVAPQARNINRDYRLDLAVRNVVPRSVLVRSTSMSMNSFPSEELSVSQHSNDDNNNNNRNLRRLLDGDDANDMFELDPYAERLKRAKPDSREYSIEISNEIEDIDDSSSSGGFLARTIVDKDKDEISD